MKKPKLIMPLVALICASFGSAAAAKVNVSKASKLGIPYSLEYITKHSPQSLRGNFFSSLVTFHETAAASGLYETYDWTVSFQQNGSTIYSFDTNDSYTNWGYYGSNDEIWLGSTVTPDPGTYTIVIHDNSGVGGHYDGLVNFTDATGQPNTSSEQDVYTDRQDFVLPGVYVDGTNEVDIYVNKDQ
jgi:hypothetical protein